VQELRLNDNKLVNLNAPEFSRMVNLTVSGWVVL
jgi:hypothetical protein